jgi:cytochrome c553
MIKTKAMSAILLVSLLLFGCSDTTNTETTTDTPSTSTTNDVENEITDSTTNLTTDSTTDSTVNLPETTFVSKYTPDEGRLLASQCSQCHGTNGISTNRWDSIAGEGNLHQEMFEYDAPIMLAQARGYTDAEISLIEGYLTSVPKNNNNENYDNNDNDDNDDDENEEDEKYEEDND